MKRNNVSPLLSKQTTTEKCGRATIAILISTISQIKSCFFQPQVVVALLIEHEKTERTGNSRQTDEQAAHAAEQKLQTAGA